MNFRKIFYPVATILIVCFIFFNSMQNGQDSSNTSTTVLNIINSLINKIGLSFEVSGHFVRKSAHFIEFFLLGISLMFTFEAFFKKTLSIIGFPLFLGLFIPVIDEFIQSFSIGRASLVSDVLLDFSAALTGILYVCLWTYIKNKKFRNKNI